MHLKTKVALLVVAAYLAALVTASLITDAMGIIGLLLILISVLVVAPLALWQLVRRLRRKPFLKWALLVPALMMIGGVLSLAVCIVRSPSPVLAEGSDASEQLAYMHETDQGDRYTPALPGPAT